jgi:ABC-type transport system substrate-binding protein
VNALLNRAAVLPNQAERLKLYRAAEEQIVRDAPWVFLYHSERYVMKQPWVEGYKLHPMWSARYEYISTGGAS